MGLGPGVRVQPSMAAGGPQCRGAYVTEATASHPPQLQGAVERAALFGLPVESAKGSFPSGPGSL